jgi:polyphosphate kinase
VTELPDLKTDLKNPELYINRELSLLEFNRRVLAQAMDENTPLLERLRFLCISSTNLDEFFEIRVAGLKQKAELGLTQTDADGRTPTELLRDISDTTRALVDEQYGLLNNVLLPELEQQGISFIRRTSWSAEQEKWVSDFFHDSLLPLISPMVLDPSHPFPRILNKSLNFIVLLKGRDAFGRVGGFAIVQAPRALPRIIQFPKNLKGGGPNDYVFLSSIIHAHVDSLFPGMKVLGCHQFRVTRNSDLYVDEEEIDDLLRALEGELQSRRYGAVVRLETAHDTPDNAIEFLSRQFGVKPDDLYRVDGPVNLNRLLAVCDIVDRADLKFTPFTPSMPEALSGSGGIFQVLRKRNILIHHPFESFLPVIDFLKQAASDSRVLAIKQTLYRTGPDSAVVDALVEAARAGKEVTVVIELRARFDEEANIELANRLQEAGAHVVYGVVGYKTHAKMVLVVRKEGKKLRHYVHLGTGNYHHRTARIYTDYGFLTSDEDIGEDVGKVFLQLTSLGKVPKLVKLMQSPFTLHEGLLKKIAQEAKNAQQGKPARIIAKVNSLVELQIIQALYEASMTGVQIDLIIRGISCLRPGVAGISENIRVRSVIGRFLEHTRVYYFENNVEPEVYCASADWMDRNLFRRVEVAFPIEQKVLKKRVIDELNYYLKDNTQAWQLQSDGSYVRCVPGEEEAFTAQLELLNRLAEAK